MTTTLVETAQHIDLTAAEIEITAWRRPLPFEPSSDYCERYWLPIIGPSTLALVRYAARLLGQQGAPGTPVRVAPNEIARAIGLSSARLGSNSPLARTVQRMCSFQLARLEAPSRIAVTHRLGMVTERMLQRFPEPEQLAHRDFERLAAPL